MWSIIVHGGAGAIDPALSEPHQAGCRAAASAGQAVLARGGAAMDAVLAAVRVLEDDPVFNAGVGSTLDERGVVMTDASIMRGSDLAFGAIGAVTGIRHPIDLARAVLEDGRWSLLVGPGALDFARERGVARCDPRSLETDPSRSRWWATRAGDTVGAVALDVRGELVAGTSTGGLLGKHAGRVGDSPIPGAGTYARTDWGGVSTTGHGETMMRTVLAFQALRSLVDRGDRAPEAVLAECLEDARARVGGRGGLIAVLPSGHTAWSRNTAHMGVAWATDAEALDSAF